MFVRPFYKESNNVQKPLDWKLEKKQQLIQAAKCD